MHYVKLVTPLVLKRWVWPTIKCFHLTPQSIYSYIDDLVITNCLIDARVFVHALSHISICHFIVWACWLHIFLIRGHPFVALIVWLFFFCQIDGQECLRTSSSYLCFSHLNSIHATSQSLIKSDSNTLCEEHSESPIHHNIKLPKPLCAFWYDRFI